MSRLFVISLKKKILFYETLLSQCANFKLVLILYTFLNNMWLFLKFKILIFVCKMKYVLSLINFILFLISSNF